MQPAALAAVGVLALLTGCGGEGPAATPPAPTPTPTPTTGTVAAAPPTPATTSTGTVPELAPPEPAAPDTRAGYLERLDALAEGVEAAIDEAAKSGDSTAIAEIDRQVMRLTKDWLAGGGTPSPAAAALAQAIATARTNVETPLLAPESQRQVRAARGAIAQELAGA